MSLKNIYKAQAKLNLSSDEESWSDSIDEESGTFSPSQVSHGDEPLIPRRRRHKIYHVRGKRKTKSGNFTCIVCFILAITCVVGIMLVLLSLLKDSSRQTNILDSAMTNASVRHQIRGCTNFSSSLVWKQDIPKLMTETATRLNDVNKDGIPDIILGFSTILDGYYIGEIPQKVLRACEKYYNKSFPCFGGVLALDGSSGEEIWRHYTMHEVFAINCNADLDYDGVQDCLIAGRAGVFEAISAHKGETLWVFRNGDPGYKEIMAIYTPQFVRDLDGDGVPEVLATHGGDPLSEPASEERLVGRLIIFSGSNGKVLKWLNVPDERETYFSPVVYPVANGSDIVLFGTGGETHPGSLWAIELLHLFLGLTSNFVRIYEDHFKGVMLPPVLADLNNDGTVDITMSMFNTTVAAFDGETFKILWQHNIPGSETYSTPAAGYFNDDDIPDFFVRYNHGQGFPSYYYSEVTVLNGINGKPFMPHFKSSVMVNTSPLSVSMTGAGNDLFLYWNVDCVGHEGKGDWFEFVEGTNQHDQSRADTCKLRYNAKSYSQFSVMNRQVGFPGHIIYNSLHHNSFNRKETKQRRHIGPPDHGGFQRLIQTGSLASTLTGKNDAIDIILMTFWTHPAKVRIITEKEKECIAHYRNLSRIGKFENQVSASDNFKLGNYDEGDTATNICLEKKAKDDNGTHYLNQSDADQDLPDSGYLTVFRIRLKCSCKGLNDGEKCSKFLPMSKQSWSGYMGTLSNSFFIDRTEKVNKSSGD